MSEPWKTDRWFASAWNFDPEFCAGGAMPPHVQFHDVTLRDGEQQAGVVLSREERISIACALSECGVDRIEAGMPAESATEREFFEQLARLNLRARLFAFAACNAASVKTAQECGAQGIVLKVTTSEHLLARGYHESREKATDDAIGATLAAKAAGLYTVLFTIDSTRTPIDEYLAMVETITAQGHCDSIAIADSYGVAAPYAIAGATRALKKRLQLPVEIHCHNDFGLAVANTLAGLMAGAEVAHVTVCGIGERAGNASLEEMAMAVRCLLGARSGIVTEHLYGLSQMVRRYGAFNMPPNRPVVGDDLYKIESAVVAMLHRRCHETDPLEYLPFLPEVAGRPGVEIAFGKGSGSANVDQLMEERGLTATEEEKCNLARRIREAALDRKRLLHSDELTAILRAQLGVQR